MTDLQEEKKLVGAMVRHAEALQGQAEQMLGQVDARMLALQKTVAQLLIGIDEKSQALSGQEQRFAAQIDAFAQEVAQLGPQAFDKFKIDKSFMSLIGTKNANVAVLDTIVKLGRSLNMKVTVEGVETQEQADFFRNLDCDYYQGYLFGRPMSQQDAAALILSGLLIDMAADCPSSPGRNLPTGSSPLILRPRMTASGL